MLIPKEVKNIIYKLKKAGFEAFIVGGCVRDFLLHNEKAASSRDEASLALLVRDWDITTNAKPEEIQKV